MTNDQKIMARALAFCKFAPAIHETKRFAVDMRIRAEQENPPALTPKQHHHLCRCVIRFRRQIREEVVTLAQQELDRLAQGGVAPC